MRYCSVMGCTARATTKDLPHFKFPLIQSSDPELIELTKKRQKAWKKALKRKDLDSSRYKYISVCSRHFISGHSAKLEDINNPDWKPTQDMGYEMKSKQYTVRETIVDITPKIEPDDYNIYDHNYHKLLPDTALEELTKTVATQTNLTMINQYDIKDIKEEISKLKHILSKVDFDLERYKSNDLCNPLI